MGTKRHVIVNTVGELLDMLGTVDNPDIPIRYFNKSTIWMKGLEEEDVEIVFYEDRVVLT